MLTKHRAIVVQLTAAQTFLKPPYRWHVGSLGLLALSGFIGALLAFYVGGPLIDLISNRARRRQGTKQRRPEARLVAIFLPAFAGPVGLLTFGLCIANKTVWVGPAVGYALTGFGLTALSNIAVTYAVDCYQSVSKSIPTLPRGKLAKSDETTAGW